MPRSLRILAFAVPLLIFGGSVFGMQVEDTEFSVARGFFDAPFAVELGTDTPGAVIRYTLDGSAPTAIRGQTYRHPIPVAETTVLRAAAFRPGLIPSNIDTQTYVFLDDVLLQDGEGLPETWGDERGQDYAVDPDIVNHPEYGPQLKEALRAVPTLSLVLDQDDLFSDEVLMTDDDGVPLEHRGIYLVGKGFERACSAELIWPDGREGFQINCSLEIQGASSTDRWKLYKLSMRLKFKPPYGPTKLDYPLFGEDASDDINTVILDATNQQSWLHPEPAQQLRGQYIRDQFLGDLQNAMGGHAPHGKYAHVYLNGQYWGMYWLHEFAEEHWAANYRGGEPEDYDILRHRIDNIVSGSADSYEAMFELLDSASVTDPAIYARVHDFLDLPKFVDYMLANFYAGNTDWAWQNWVSSRNRNDPDSRWQFHNWDGERTFISIEDDVTNPTGLNKAVPDPIGTPTWLHHRLVASPEYRLLFADRVYKHMFNGGVLTAEMATQMYLDRLSQIEMAIIGESARWGDNRNPGQPPYTKAHWEAERDRLLTTFFPQRTEVVLDQLRGHDLFLDFMPPTVNQAGGEIAAGFKLKLTNPNSAGDIYYTLSGADPRETGGAVAAGAEAYTGPLPLSEGTRLMARVHDAVNGVWSPLADYSFYPGTLTETLKVTEIMYNPAEPTAIENPAGTLESDDFEYLELANLGDAALDLSGVTFSRGIALTLSSANLEPGERGVLVKNPDAFSARYGSGANILGVYTESLGNGGERLAMRGRFGQPIFDFTYDDGWYAATDGGGSSLVLADESAQNDAMSAPPVWRPSTSLGGTPGSAGGQAPDLRITELMYHPDNPSSEEEAAGHNEDELFEFIEVRNFDTETLNLQGMQLESDDTLLFTFPAGQLAPGAHALVVNNLSGFQYRWPGAGPIVGTFAPGLNLDNGSGRIRLLTPDGKTILDFEYDDDWYPVTDGEGPSLVVVNATADPAQWSEEEQWMPSVALQGSPGLAEPAPPPGLRISEIHFMPSPPTATEAARGFDDVDDFEFIEFINAGDTPLSLEGYSIEDGVDFVFPAIVLQPGETTIAVSDDAAFGARYGNRQIAGEYDGQLRDTGEKIILVDSQERVILNFKFKPENFPTLAVGGKSLVKRDLADHPASWADSANWMPGRDSGGSPLEEENGFWEWQWVQFLGPGHDIVFATPEVDPDKDGLPNLIEYAFSRNPLRRDALDHDVFVLPVDSRLHLGFSHVARVGEAGLTYSVEISDENFVWTAATDQLVEHSRVALRPGYELVTYRSISPLDELRVLYARILVTLE